MRRTFFPRATRAASGPTRTTTSRSSARQATRSPIRHHSSRRVAADPATRQLLGLFNDGNIDGALDRKFLKKGTVGKFPDQPDLTDEMRAALQVLSRNANGFLLMVEAGRIDKYSHSLDWERAVYDTIMFDNVVRIAKDFAAGEERHAHRCRARSRAPGIDHRDLRRCGRADVARASFRPMRRLGFPTIRAPDSEGYPPSVDVSRRLALVFAAYPDYCDAGKPFLAGENEPTKPAADGEKQIVNETYCQPGAARKIGNLGAMAKAGVHSADDVILTASGPGAAAFHGRVDNTFVFRAMATALGLGQ